jgi:hypothetical protein
MQPPVVTMMHLISWSADQANALISRRCALFRSWRRTPAHDPFAREIEADIADFCNKHPDELFCGKLARWMRQHGKTNP